jgi:hypothetical protein
VKNIGERREFGGCECDVHLAIAVMFMRARNSGSFSPSFPEADAGQRRLAHPRLARDTVLLATNCDTLIRASLLFAAE